jgi:predicted Zn-dependent protease with MMP-like domain
VDLHHHWLAGGGEHAARGAAGGSVNRRTERLAKYAGARRRSAPRTSFKVFEALVAQALDSLPNYFKERLENVAVIVEERARPERLARLGDDPSLDLLGLYEGINRIDRASGYHLVTPDRITLFWRPIIEEVGSGGPEAIRREVRKTIMHEVAHHFGMDDAELERLGG